MSHSFKHLTFSPMDPTKISKINAAIVNKKYIGMALIRSECSLSSIVYSSLAAAIIYQASTVTQRTFTLLLFGIMRGLFPGGGGGTLGSIFAGYVRLASQSPYPIIVYSVANYRPHLSQFCGNVNLVIPT